MAYNPRDKAQNWLPGYLRAVADKMDLRDWEFELQAVGADDNTLAGIKRFYGQRKAAIRIGERFWARDRVAQRLTVIHEMLHCHHAAPDEWIAGHLKGPEYEAWEFMMEYSIDAVAVVVAPFMPLPPRLPKKTKQKTA